MPTMKLISEFGRVFELATRLNSDLYHLNKGMSERDPVMTMMDYRKAKLAFRELKVAMIDLDRAVEQISSEIPLMPPDFGIDPSI